MGIQRAALRFDAAIMAAHLTATSQGPGAADRLIFSLMR